MLTQDSGIRVIISPDDATNREFDVVTVVDILYLLDSSETMSLLKKLRRFLKNDGVLILKEVVRKSNWKDRLACAEEYLAVKVLGITRGSHIEIRTESELVRMAGEAGFKLIRSEGIGRFYPHNHHLFVFHVSGGGL